MGVTRLKFNSAPTYAQQTPNYTDNGMRLSNCPPMQRLLNLRKQTLTVQGYYANLSLCGQLWQNVQVLLLSVKTNNLLFARLGL